MNSELSSTPGDPAPKGRVRVLTLGLAFVVLLVLSIALASYWTRNKTDQSAASDVDKSSAASNPQPPASSKATVSLKPSHTGALLNSDSKSSAAATVAAEALIARLTNLKINKVISKEQAAQINETFKSLIDLGPSAIPAIRAFLARNEDISFAAFENSKALDHETVRLGLLDSLHQIGGPESLDVALETLRTTADPRELALLASSIERQAPGKFREETIAAARESLRLAQEGGLADRDVGPLFQIFQSYGTPDLVTDLQQTFPQWSYYSALTLGNLPNGEGIPALVNQLSEPSAMESGSAGIALQALSQVAVNEPAASEALLRMARDNQISDEAWNAIALGLEGYSFEVGSPSDKGSRPFKSKSSLETHVVPDTGEKLFTTPVTASWLEETLDTRIALIDQLLANTSNPAGLQALQDARASLEKKKVETVSVYK